MFAPREASSALMRATPRADLCDRYVKGSGSAGACRGGERNDRASRVDRPVACRPYGVAAVQYVAERDLPAPNPADVSVDEIRLRIKSHTTAL